MPVDVKFAVNTAVEYVKTLLGNVQDVRLEEVQPRGDGWSLTVSFMNRDLVGLPFGKREFKEVELDKFGQPVAMRIREVE